MKVDNAISIHFTALVQHDLDALFDVMLTLVGLGLEVLAALV